jgi:Fur family ferric uptake transcriptional regulator
MPARPPSPDERFARFEEHLRGQSLKSTAQRDTIARTFFASRGHISVEELYREVRKKNPRIGYATVYRTMKLLTECGLADERHFRGGEARYESAEKRHHDHLICEACGRIVEFEEERIERLQEEIAARLGFRLTGHRMELYGFCPACRSPKEAAASSPNQARKASSRRAAD